MRESAWRFISLASWGVFALAFAGACRTEKAGAGTGTLASASPLVSASSPLPASASASASASAPTSASASASASASSRDAGALACRPVRGPIELPLKSAVTLFLRGDSLEALQNDDGRPRLTAFGTGPAPTSSPPAREAAEPGVTSRGLGVACARAGEYAFCPDRSGGVHRSRLEGTGDRIVASSRAGSRVGAGLLGARAAVSYLASRKTSEGWVSEAWLTVDDDPPLRISEDGSGATSLALAEHKGGLFALAIDARAALTALHARTIAYDGQVRLGEDVVVFVGGPGDRRTGAALGVPGSGPGWALLPIAKDVGTFGLAVVRLGDPPRVDEPVVWSMYPNGLDPAPIAAAVSGGKTWVARVLPQAAEPGAPRVLELGQIDAEGAFASRGTLPTSGNASDVALAVDAAGALWIAWVDAAGAWLERLSCR